MTRKRIGSGLLESFSESCEHCNGRGIRVSLHADDHHHDSPKGRKPANAVDPAEVAARALAAHEEADETEVEPETDAGDEPVTEVTGEETAPDGALEEPGLTPAE
jgi:ribonuclease E